MGDCISDILCAQRLPGPAGKPRNNFLLSENLRGLVRSE